VQASQDLPTTAVRSRRHGCARRVTAPAAQKPSKRVAKVAVEARVDDWVERRVGVTDPEQDGDAPVGQLGAGVGAERRREVPGEERQPADEERAHDDAERLGGLVFSLHQPTLT